MKYLIDTNVISELKRSQPNAQVLAWLSTVHDESLYLSVLSLGEIRKGVEKVSDLQRQADLRRWLEHALPEWFEERLLPINADIANLWGKLQAQMNRPLPAIDSLLATTALHHDLCLVTRNTKDFVYPHLTVLNPWEQTDR